ncbi:ABC transporter ATP-binding protein [Komagataeibacter rhaeticus]|uniref:ABC transporter ATP-binding protein n=1 Tax=Komagataeibacter rhaeticus TaxID=215221 RepID=UPI0004D860BA|nr:ABC transporter ATP-binding protein [Komagataeibacter rhaeticus]KDU96621.1 nitrate ABC transporter ATPase [Komagataeibacter rhaeticus AF1]MBL7239264.1 ABC transporter ATP-binding protein [Komagataeibacter rhaeticus]PYD52705.1 ABC transporter ATP-binding protein [Komagataeibacter rhaeticus]
MMDPIVGLWGVEKVFGNGVRALAPVNLAVQPGEFISLIGPSGCGKSTLLKVIASIHAPSAGQVRWWGRDFAHVGSAGHRMAFVFQDPTLMPWACMEDNVRLPLDLERMPATTAGPLVRDALEQVGLGHVLRHYPAQLSGGMKMRASIARALVTQPDLLLMDEPFGALDEFSRNRLDEEMARLCYEKGLTTLFVTHSLYEAVFLSSRVIVMAANPGRIFGEYHIDPAIRRDETFRLSDDFAHMCRDLTQMLTEATHATFSGGA